MQIKMNNYYFDSIEKVDEYIKQVIINENIDSNLKLDEIIYEDEDYEDGIRQFTVSYWGVPLAIMSLLENVNEDKLVINYQKISQNGE